MGHGIKSAAFGNMLMMSFQKYTLNGQKLHAVAEGKCEIDKAAFISRENY
jgi:hypothetical protein